jgi:hypothetical protein
MGIKFKQDLFGSNSEIKINKEAMNSFQKDLQKQYALSIKQHVLQDAIPSLGPKNFEGEAIEFLRQNMLPITEKGLPEIKGIRPAIPGVKELSLTMLTTFVKNIDDMIVYDEEANLIVISPFIMSLEYGDFYRPILKTLTRSIEDLLKTN